jgi:hypothetical protein
MASLQVNLDNNRAVERLTVKDVFEDSSPMNWTLPAPFDTANDRANASTRFVASVIDSRQIPSVMLTSLT